MFGLGTLRRVAGEVRRDVAAAHDRDPAARGVSSVEILASWPGVHALLAHRVLHALHHAGVPFVPRLLSTATRAITNIEIHPAARIGDALFIDHGTGVVVGETAEIGDNVTLYQGVTLGGTGFATGKRHPTVQDNVTTGWVTMAASLAIGTGGAYLGDQAVSEIFGGERFPVIAGQGTRPGTAVPTDGGHLLSGSWSFASGLLHSGFIHTLGVVEETGEPRIFVVPVEKAELIHNWDV